MSKFAILALCAVVAMSCAEASQISDIVIELMHPKYFETRVKGINVKNPNNGSNSHTLAEPDSFNLATRVIKELPQNARVTIRLYEINPESQRMRVVRYLTMNFCKGNEKPAEFAGIFNVVQLRSRCIDRNLFNLKYMQQIDYENLLSNLTKSGEYFKLDFTVSNFFDGKILKGYVTISRFGNHNAHDNNVRNVNNNEVSRNANTQNNYPASNSFNQNAH